MNGKSGGDVQPIYGSKYHGKSQRWLSDSFYSNSVFIILSSILSSGVGLLFWILAANLYSKENIGISTVLISSASMVVLISRLGLDQSMTRFFCERDRSTLFSSTAIITALVALVVGMGFVLTADIWSPNLSMISNWGTPFILLVLVQSVVVTTTSAFVAMRKAKLQLIQNIVMGSRLAWLFPLVGLGVIGIVSSFVLALGIVLIFSLYLLQKLSLKIRRIDRSFVRSSLSFSAGNYISAMLVGLPFLIMPLIVLNQLGASETANYYMAYSFANIVFTIPVACSTQLFVEGSHGEELKKTTRKSLLASYLILIPLIAAIFLWGKWLLGFLGMDYAEGGYGLLKLLALSSLLMVPFQTYFSIILVRKEMKWLIVISLLNCITILGLSYLFLMTGDLESVGYAWILGYGMTSLFVYISARKMIQ